MIWATSAYGFGSAEGNAWCAKQSNKGMITDVEWRELMSELSVSYGDVLRAMR